MIADPYNPAKEVPEGFIVKMIPEFTWAVFPCKGAMPYALQDVNTKIFTEWLPALKDYEFAAAFMEDDLQNRMQDLTTIHSYLASNFRFHGLLYSCKPKKGELQYEKYEKVF